MPNPVMRSLVCSEASDSTSDFLPLVPPDAADTEREAKLDAERVTLEFRQKSTKRLDAGRRSIEDSPLFGGERQEEMF